jgi:sodium transport system ATP-binding protein
MMALVGVRKTYGEVVAIENVSFAAANGHVTGVLGPNGAGKTTALRVLTGLIQPSKGSAVIDGIEVGLQPRAARAALGVLPQSNGLYDRLTVREHLRYAAALQEVGRAGLVDRVERALDQFALRPIAHRRAGTLSVGQRRRVSLAAALIHDPQNVVLDEPTSGLDVLAARDVRQDVRRLAGRGRAVILSSHVMPEVAAVCDQIVILAKGLVVATGTPAALQARTGRPTLEEAFVDLIGSEEGLN